MALRGYAAQLAPMVEECRPGLAARRVQLVGQAKAGARVVLKRPAKRPACEIEGHHRKGLFLVSQFLHIRITFSLHVDMLVLFCFVLFVF